MRISSWKAIGIRFAMCTPVLFAILVMASPALANSSSWYFYENRDGRVVDGSKNGIYHTLTAGTLTISGSIWTAAIYPGSTSVQGITIEVRKPAFLGSTTICSTGPYYPSANNIGKSYAVTVSKNCGGVGAASDYYLYVWRSNTDGREVEGSGNLTT